MNRLILLTVPLLISSFSAFAQEKPSIVPDKAQTTTTKVDVMPKPDFNYAEYMAENVKVPKVADKGKAKYARVVLKFKVDAQGNLGNIRVLKKSKFPELDAEAVRIVKGMPKWKPGMSNGKPVEVHYTLPIKFIFDDDEEKEE